MQKVSAEGYVRINRSEAKSLYLAGSKIVLSEENYRPSFGSTFNGDGSRDDFEVAENAFRYYTLRGSSRERVWFWKKVS